MRKFNYFMSFIALGVVLTSCQKEELDALVSPDIDETTEIGGYLVNISASSPTSDTKVTIDGINVAWETGDRMTVARQPATANASGTVNLASLKFRPDTAVMTAGDISGNTAVFSGMMSPLGILPTASRVNESIYAIYPNVNNEKFTFIAGALKDEAWKTKRVLKYDFLLPMTQDHKYKDADLALDPSAISPYVLMYGSSPVLAGDGPDITLDMSMTHLMTYFDVTLLGLPNGTKVDSLCVIAPEVFVTKAVYNCYPINSTNKTLIVPTRTILPITVRLINHMDDKGVLFPSTGRLKVRFAAGIIGATTIGTSWTFTAYGGGKIIGTVNSQPATKDFSPGDLYNLEVTLEELITEKKSVTKTELAGLAAATPHLITELVVTEGTLDSLDFTYIKKMNNLVSLDISGTTTTNIPTEAFDGRTTLTSIKFNPELKTIGEGAFRSTGLTTVTIPNSVEEIMGYVFQKSKLESFHYEDIDQSLLRTFGSSVFHSSELKGTLRIPKGVSSIGTFFLNSTNLDSLIFEPNSAMLVIPGSFALQSTFRGITLPDVLLTLSAKAFDNCPNLNNVIIPSTVTLLGASVFNRCTSLKVITFTSAAPPVIDPKTFVGPKNLTDIFVPDIATFTFSTANPAIGAGIIKVPVP